MPERQRRPSRAFALPDHPAPRKRGAPHGNQNARKYTTEDQLWAVIEFLLTHPRTGAVILCMLEEVQMRREERLYGRAIPRHWPPAPPREEDDPSPGGSEAGAEAFKAFLQRHPIRPEDIERYL